MDISDKRNGESSSNSELLFPNVSDSDLESIDYIFCC